MISRVSMLIASILLSAPLRAQNAGAPSSARGLLVVANQKEHTVSLVSADQKRELAKWTVGVNGHEVAVSPDGRFAYVPIYSNTGVGKPGTDGNSIDVIDLQARKMAASIDLGKPVRPHRAAFGPDGLLYVTAELASALDVIDPATRKVLAEIPTGQEQSHMVVLSSDGQRAYTANVGTGSVSALDLQKRSLISVIPVATTIQRLSITPDGARIFTHDQGKPRVAVIDTATLKLTSWIELPDVAYASTISPDGRWLLLVCMGANRIHVLDLKSMKIVHSIDVPQMPSELLVRPDGKFAYVSCVAAGKIAVIDLSTWQLQDSIVLLPGVDGLAWDSTKD
jgi:YVTN family beta-propeller protein